MPSTKFTRTFTGCIRCRQQRTKCDETKPTCVKCSRKGYVCEYESLAGMRVSVYDPATKKVKAKRSKKVPGIKAPAQDTSHYSDHSSSSPDLLESLQPLYGRAISDQIVAAFFGGNSLSKYRKSFSWLPLVIAMPVKPEGVQRALTAVSMGRIAWLYGDKNLELQSHQEYWKALKLIQVDLWNPRHAWNEGTLAAMQLLRIFELIGGGFMGSAAHVNGIRSYLKTLRSQQAWEKTSALTLSIVQDASQHLLYINAFTGEKTDADLIDAMQTLGLRANSAAITDSEEAKFAQDGDPQVESSLSTFEATWLTSKIYCVTADLYLACNDPEASLISIQRQARELENLLFELKARIIKSDPLKGNVVRPLEWLEPEAAYQSIMAAGDLLNVGGYIRQFDVAVTPIATGRPCFPLHPELRKHLAPDFMAFQEERLRYYLPLIQDGSAVALMRSYSLMWMFFIKGRGADQSQLTQIVSDFSRSTGIKSADGIDSSMIEKFWNGLVETASERKEVFYKFLSANLKDTGNVEARPWNQLGRKYPKFPHTRSGDVAMGMVHRSDFAADSLDLEQVADDGYVFPLRAEARRNIILSANAFMLTPAASAAPGVAAKAHQAPKRIDDVVSLEQSRPLVESWVTTGSSDDMNAVESQDSRQSSVEASPPWMPLRRLL